MKNEAHYILQSTTTKRERYETISRLSALVMAMEEEQVDMLNRAADLVLAGYSAEDAAIIAGVEEAIA